MKILVLNSGSSSIKYQLLDMPEATLLAKGLVQGIGEPSGQLEQTVGAAKVSLVETLADHSAGLRRAVSLLTDGAEAPIADVAEIKAVGHRVVHGGEHFTETAIIDDEVVAAIEAHSSLAPLHNPPNLQGIQVARQLLPNAMQVAVFDTAFHQTMPERAFLYALPSTLYREGRIRRYGFHGTSHRYVAARAAEMLGRELTATNLITCHLGNGSSMAAIEGGRSVDTSMGLTPLEGLVMGTRCGDIDPAIVLHLAKVEGMSIDAIDKLLNKKSGLLGVSGSSNDVRRLLELEADGDEAAHTALDLFVYRIRKYIGAYAVVLGRVDAIVFTAGIGENSPQIRSRVCEGLGILGVELDADKNAETGLEADISTADAGTRVLVVPTNEEKRIALDTYALAT